MNFKTKIKSGYQMGSLPPQGSVNKPPIYTGQEMNKPAIRQTYDKGNSAIKKQGNK